MGLQFLAGLTHIQEVACFTGQTVDPTFVVARGWFGELCYCVAAFVTDFDICVSKYVSDFSYVVRRR